MVLLILNTVPVAFATDVTYQFGEESINTTWTTVTFDEAFSNTPLVFAEIQTENGSHAVQVDLRNVTMTSFQIRLEEDRGRNRGWLDGWHYYEDVNWFAIDPTEYTANDGVEVGSVNYKQLLRSNWGSVIFSETFSDTPLVLALIQTENGTDTVRADIRNLTSTGFEFRLEEDRGRSSTVNSWDGWHTTETVGYIAIDPALDLSPWNILFNTGETTSSWATVCFESDCSDVFVDTPSVFVEIQSENESDTVQIDIKNVSVSGFDVRLEELAVAGWDAVHGTEEFSWFAFGEIIASEPEPEPVSLDVLVVETSSSGVSYIISILENAGHTVTSMTSFEIESAGSLSTDDYDLVVYPGGEDAAYDGMNTALQTIFQDYVYQGGGFIGICGGAIAGSEQLHAYTSYYDYTTDMLGIGLGVTADYDISWLDYVGASIIADFELETDHAILGGAYTTGDTLAITYAGGPVFTVDDTVTVIASYTIDIVSDTGYSSNGMPAIVETSYGDGTVILFAPHPEFNASTHFLLENAALYVSE
ncbi:MAG: hypothetical protein UW03_C0010G0021 [Candidatus Peregrinibacteria bacterium GW2011_GWA2_43_8]|nr:MAG: hypothetical protein UW03_C0010G0021 [Candidatus Peregrinibacteria bacterium GW2011_GWA2_43_8]